MKKFTKVAKAPESEAVRELRISLGESQQAFAYRMKTAIRTIARYETVRPPKGTALADLYRVATETGHPKLANVFANALQAELGPIKMLTALGAAAYSYLPPHCEELREAARILRSAPRSPEVDAAITKLDTAIERTVKKFKVYLPQEATK